MSQALTMARIRNTGRQEMTRDTSHISAEQQRIWWAENKDSVRCWLYCFGKVVVGFGMVRNSAGTLCIWPRFRGLHLGTTIYQHLKEETNGDIWIEVRKTNLASVKAALRAGYHPIGNNGETWTMTPYD